MSRGAWKSSFSPESRGTVVEHCRKYTVGRRRTSQSSWMLSLALRTRVLDTPAVVVARRPRTPWSECGCAYQKVRGTRGGPGLLKGGRSGTPSV